MNDLFLRACRREPVDRPPIWLMRQAGRYLPEYRAVRERVDFVTLCRTPELAVQVTLQPLDRFALDAAILFSDILVLGEAMGFGVEFKPGPVIDRPVRTQADVDRVRLSDPEEELPYVYETLRLLRGELSSRVPLIGFAAAPLTLAVYLVEGGPSKNFENIKALLLGDPATAHKLMEKVSEMTARYVTAQVAAGAQAVQLFDTWAGVMSPDLYAEFGLRYAQQVLARLRDAGVPRIYFALNSAHLLPAIRECDAEVIGIDWRTGLDEASRALGDRFVLQGNLDPCVLLAGRDAITSAAADIIEAARRAPGHIFNLGHGLIPATPPEGVAALVEAVTQSGGSGSRT